LGNGDFTEQQRYLFAIGGLLNFDNLTQHNHGVALHDSDAAETSALLEALNNERLNWLKLAFGHVTILDERGVLDLLLTSGLAHLEDDLGELNSRTTSAHKGDGGVTNLELTGVVKNNDLHSEGLGADKCLVGLEDHDVTNMGHVRLFETLDVETNIVTGIGSWARLVVHLNSEDLSSAGGGGGVGGDKDDFITRLHSALLEAASDNITNTLDLVNAGNGHAHGLVTDTGRGLNHIVEGIKQVVDVDSCSDGGLDVNTSPPFHVGRLLEQIVSLPSGDREEGHLSVNLGLLPANTHQHSLDLLLDFLITSLSIVDGLVIHFVDADDELFNTEKVDQAGVLTSLTLNFSGLVIALSDGGLKATNVRRNHEKSNICLGSTGDHVLDEIPVAGGINDGVVVTLSEELLGGASDGNTALALLLLVVHEEGKAERALAKSIGFSTQLFHFTFRDSSKLVDETTGGGRFAGIDVPADNN